MTESAIVRWTKAAAISLAMLATPGFAIASDNDIDSIVACMISKTSNENRMLMRKFVIAALNDDSAAVKKYVVQMGFLISDLALNKCEMDFALLSKPEFKTIAKNYGQILGEDMMNRAFAKIK